MRLFYVAGRVVAHPYEHNIERQSFTPEVDRFFRYLYVPQALQSLVLQLVTVLTTIDRRLLLQLKQFHFPSTVLTLFQVSAKMPVPGSKLYGRKEDISVSSTL